MRLHPLPSCSTPSYGTTWAYRALGYPGVWRNTQEDPYTKAVTVAVLDTGVRYDYPDLKGQLYRPGDGALDLLATRDGSGKGNGDGDAPDTDPTDPATPGRTDISLVLIFI